MHTCDCNVGTHKISLQKRGYINVMQVNHNSDLKLFFSHCSSRQIQAAPTNATVDGFKASLVFREIQKKLEEVCSLIKQAYLCGFFNSADLWNN